MDYYISEPFLVIFAGNKSDIFTICFRQGINSTFNSKLQSNSVYSTPPFLFTVLIFVQSKPMKQAIGLVSMVSLKGFGFNPPQKK